MIGGSSLSRRGQIYITVVALCGALAIVDSGRRLVAAPPEYTWLIVAALTWISGMFAIKIPSIAASISISEVFVFTLVILFGWPTATLTVALDGVLTSLIRKNRQPRRIVFNIAEPALSTWIGGCVYQAVGGPPPLSIVSSPLSEMVIPVLLLAGTYLLLNTSLIAVAMAIETHARAREIFNAHIAWLSVNFMGGASIALLLTANMAEVNLAAILLVLPLLVILHMVFSTWTQRLGEAERHVSEMNRLYLTTVKALAIAIESKDQVTHSHVCRVQELSLAVARKLAVSDPLQLRALEAGALLHDMGKVAIPDHILNKPGKLTAAEYDLMKLHAPIGAEILSTVEFPYPVVPIVRHHHENWDGTGYPDGLAGESIPLGARILSVVDCFDALTSNRPYRRALSTPEAIDIIRARRGSMYDPAVTDALLAVHDGVTAAAAVEVAPVSVLIARANEKLPPSLEWAPGPPPAQGATWTEFDGVWPLIASGPAGRDRPGTIAAPAMAAFLRAMTPATTVCIGRLNSAAQRVEFVHVSGHGEQLLRDRTVPMGEGLVGWVSANRWPMSNSDPALDFPDAIDRITPRLVKALAVPIATVGVLVLYTDSPAGFSDADRAIAEEAASRLEDITFDPALAGPAADEDRPLRIRAHRRPAAIRPGETVAPARVGAAYRS